MHDRRRQGGFALPHPETAKFRSTRWIYADTGLATDRQELDRLARENAAYTVGYYARLACSVGTRYRTRLLATIRPIGLERVLAAHALGRGLILVAPHLGDFDLAVAWIAEAVGGPPVVPVAHLGRPWAQSAFGVARRACRFELIDSGAASLPALTEQLRKGRTVVLTLDRRSGRSALVANFFGRPRRLPAGCLRLARASGAPLVSVATWNQIDKRILNFGEPLVAGSRSAPEDDEQLLQSLASDLEAAIRSAPQQWHIPARLDELSVTSTVVDLPPLLVRTAR